MRICVIKIHRDFSSSSRTPVFKNVSLKCYDPEMIQSVGVRWYLTSAGTTCRSRKSLGYEAKIVLSLDDVLLLMTV